MLNERITYLAQQALSNDSQFLVEVLVSSNRGPTKITVVLDGDKGVTIDDCSAVSRNISKAIEEEDLIKENYTLEVTTPGLDQPLKLNRQYAKNVGRDFKIRLKDKKVVEGTLKEVSENGIAIAFETGAGKKKELQTMNIVFEDIEKALVKVSFK